MLSFLQPLCLALAMCLFFRWLFSCCLWTCWTKKKKLIFLDAWGNSLIPDKLPRKSLKWLSLPQRQGCKNWKGFHFWLFQLLQKESFSSVWSLKTVTEQIKITKIPICEPPHIQLFCPALSQGINQPGYGWCAQQQWLPGGSGDWYSAVAGLLQKIYTSIGAEEHCTPLIWMLPPCVLQKRGEESEMNGKAWEKQGCWGVICPAQLLTHLWSFFMGSEDRKTTWSAESWALPAGMAWRTR